MAHEGEEGGNRECLIAVPYSPPSARAHNTTSKTPAHTRNLPVHRVPIPHIAAQRSDRVYRHHAQDPNDLSLFVAVRVVDRMFVDEEEGDGGRDQGAGLTITSRTCAAMRKQHRSANCKK